MLSGIGAPGDLEAHEISITHELPGVGRNLQDHLALPVNYDCTRPITLAKAESIGNLLRFLLFGRGMLTSNIAEAGAFVRLDEASPAPDLQFHFGPSYFVNHGFDNPEGHGMILAPTLVQPRSIGRITLRSPDPLDPPLIDPNYLSEPGDMQILIEGIRLARRILASSPFEGYRGREYLPGEELESDEELARWVRGAAQTIYHPVGTCKMGNGPEAVVDPRLRVHGLEQLRVADASIMPTITNGNTNAPSIMIGEKASELLVS
jgi:choline dehydrogenase